MKVETGVGQYAGFCATFRSKGNYKLAACLEGFIGERRIFGPQGQTRTLIFAASLRDLDNKINILNAEGKPDEWGYYNQTF